MINVASVREKLKSPVGYFSTLAGISVMMWAINKWVLGPIRKQRKQQVLREDADYLYDQMKFQQEEASRNIYIE